MGAAANMADRMSQMEAMDGAARCLESLRLQVSLIENVLLLVFELAITQLCSRFNPIRTRFAAADHWNLIRVYWRSATRLVQR